MARPLKRRQDRRTPQRVRTFLNTFERTVYCCGRSFALVWRCWKIPRLRVTYEA